MSVEFRRGRFTISTDKSRLDVGMIHHYLSEISYWAQGRTLEAVERSIDHSLCLGVYEDGRQVGFARVVTDCVSFAWLADVFILESHRGQGLGKWLVECLVAHPEMQGLKHVLLATRDAHELYRVYGGFDGLAEPGKWMRRSTLDG